MTRGLPDLADPPCMPDQSASIGLVAATVLGLRVVVAITHDAG